MNIDIRKSISDNFKNVEGKEIWESIDEAIRTKEEVTLPGLGVFFECLWQKCSKEEKEEIVKKLQQAL